MQVRLDTGRKAGCGTCSRLFLLYQKAPRYEKKAVMVWRMAHREYVANQRLCVSSFMANMAVRLEKLPPGTELPKLLKLLFDGGPENWCSTFFLFVAWMVGTGMFEEAYLQRLPAHHARRTAGSQWARMAKSPTARCPLAAPLSTCRPQNFREGLLRGLPRAGTQAGTSTAFSAAKSSALRLGTVPLSVGLVNKVSPCGWLAHVTYMWGTSWDGTFRKAQFKDAKGNTKNWTHKDMTKQGVVLMRGRQTAKAHLNQKTKEYLCEVLGEESYYKNAKRPRAKAAAKDQPKSVKPKARAARNGPHPSSQAGRVISDASCLRQERPRAKRIHESESSECDKSDGSSSDTSAASVETCTSTYSEEILNVKIPSKNTKKRASVVEIERDRGSRPSQK